MKAFEHPFSSDWHHAPPHRFSPGHVYMLTAATIDHRNFFRTGELLFHLTETLFQLGKECGWGLIAWAIFSDHYHWIGKALREAIPLSKLCGRFHSQTSTWLNLKERQVGRRVWYQYWDTCLTYEASYYARLNYLNQNPVKHGLVPVASQYPFCSAGCFERLDSSFSRRVSTYKCDRVKVIDDFDPV